MVSFAGKIHQAGQLIYFHAILSCGSYPAHIERCVNELWGGSKFLTLKPHRSAQHSKLAILQKLKTTDIKNALSLREIVVKLILCNSN